MLREDQVIWKEFTDGNRSSFQELMTLHYKLLFNYGAKFTTDEELVKDCIQDLFLILWNKRNNLSVNVNVKAYLFSSLRRQLLRKLQSIHRYSLVNLSTVKFNFQISVEEQLITEESTAKLAKKISAAMEKLATRQKEIIYLRFFLNFSRDEIALSLNIAPQTVSNLLQIALKKLRVDLKENFDPLILYFLLPIIIKETIL